MKISCLTCGTEILDSTLLPIKVQKNGPNLMSLKTFLKTSLKKAIKSVYDIDIFKSTCHINFLPSTALANSFQTCMYLLYANSYIRCILRRLYVMEVANIEKNDTLLTST